ncbi:hypothetical protein J7J08_12550 [Stenotrophomonas sp. ISL-67]|uniref:hypothetical protein n=1 Tax=Stenotrophomonas sp. ISL-67 TaxID=2819171 RepID=UPI001BE9B3AB|nr:hypothetical protein [Stenotrophomonas sp. ISL-67]MBT2768468.1 hypothetical protein [Stenotrophomonas sp. ISL-67]
MIINGAGRPSSPPRATAAGDAASPTLGEAFEQVLATREGDFLHFGSVDMPLARDAFRSRIAATLAAYLEQGFLEGDDDAGPIQRRVATADHEEGVEPYMVNLALREDVQVFGMYNNDGCGDCYYACVPAQAAPVFFRISIESGMAAGGPYEISVSDPMDWQAFLAQLPPV